MNELQARRALRALIATPPFARERARRVFPDLNLVIPRDHAEACRIAAGESFDFIVVNLAFAESRGFELLEYLQKAGVSERTPVIGIVGPHARIVPDTLPVAVHELGACGFVDATVHPDTPEGNAAVRRAFMCLLEDGPCSCKGREPAGAPA